MIFIAGAFGGGVLFALAGRSWDRGVGLQLVSKAWLTRDFVRCSQSCEGSPVEPNRCDSIIHEMRQVVIISQFVCEKTSEGVGGR